MATIQHIRNTLIDKILAIRNKELLEELDKMITSSDPELGAIELTEDQKLMFAMSDEDLAADRVISHEALKTKAEKWLREKS